MSTKVLFIDRDGTIIKETADEQIDSFEKLVFYPKVFQWLAKIAEELDYEIVMITNQDGLGTVAFPEDTFWPIHNFIIQTFEREGIVFKDQYIDRTFAKDNAPTRKPNTGLLNKYFTEAYDLDNSIVIGDRLTDMELAKNLGSKGIFINDNTNLGTDEITVKHNDLDDYIVLETNDWKKIYEFLKLASRKAEIKRKTNETDIYIKLNLDGTGKSTIDTGLSFFDHMLDQIARHGQMDLEIKVKGDLEVDEHHTIEDTAIALGEVFYIALANKLGIERYGFCLPMDDCLAQVAIDFGGRNWLVWDAEFNREMIGKMPTEMFYHFFKSFTDGARCNLNVKAEGNNEHHKIEAIFKAFAKAIKAAVKRDSRKNDLTINKRNAIMKIVIIDYGAGNTKSIQFAIQRLGYEAILSHKAEEIVSADKVIFPGVGEAGTAMKKLRESGLDTIIPGLKQPLLGICLGMQLMCNNSEEGNTEGLGIFNIDVVKFDNTLKVPQIGWNQITNLRSGLFKNISKDEYMYTVHSYYVPLSNETIAETNYGINYSSALQKDNFYGVQFHPEKSSSAGEQLLKNFLSL